MFTSILWNGPGYYAGAIDDGCFQATTIPGNTTDYRAAFCRAANFGTPFFVDEDEEGSPISSMVWDEVIDIRQRQA
jgi:hypothetical protein